MLEEVDLIEPGEQAHAPAFRRLRAYRGAAKEVGWFAFNVAIWPLGLVDEAVRGSARKVRLRKPKQVAMPRRRPTKDAAQVPIILVHGYFHNRSGLVVMERALRKHGFQNVHTFSYNPLRKDIPALAEMLKQRVETVTMKTGCSRVHLVGHCLGGLVCRYYVEKLSGCHRVHTVVTIGTPHKGTVIAYGGRSPAARQMRPDSQFIKEMVRCRKPRSVRYLSYYTNLDAIVVPSTSAILANGNGSRVKNILVHDLGHLSLLISPELIGSIASNLSDLDSEGCA